jgi:FAD/FMN-containing dehydrogenase/Fe-S oxidoreductase
LDSTLQQLTPLPLSSHAQPVDSFAKALELETELKRTVKGEVRFDRGSRALYATDGSNYRQVPIGLVVPRDDEDVIATVAACRKYDAPVLARGSGTSLAGQCCNVAVVLDFTKYMNQILELDTERRFARVQPGVVLDTLRNRAEKHQLTFAPDPSTHNRCSIGGMIGNNSCGTHSLLGGKTVDNVEELRILLYDGTQMTVGAMNDEELRRAIEEGGRRAEILKNLARIRDDNAELIRARFPKIPRRVSGYNLDELLPERGFHVARSLVGTEGTCAIVLEAKLKLIRSPQCRTLVGLGYADAFVAADHVTEILEFQPIGVEGFEGSIVDGLRKKGAPNLDLLPAGNGFVLVEFGTDDPAETNDVVQRLMARLKQTADPPTARVYSKSEAKAVWQIRESGPRAAAFAPGAPAEWEGWDDAAVAPEKLGAYLRDIRALMNEFGYRGAFYGHFGHGCIHMRVSFDLTSENGVRKYGDFVERAADLVVSYGGSLSGEHGDGQSRGALLPKMFGPALMKAFGEFKAAWDPGNKMNPHKGVVNSYLPTENLRLGADYKPLEPHTHFQFPEDEGSLAKATLRCIGLGACRKQDAGSMCPSYMVTHEEEHSTRGRAHMLFEMLQGEVLRDGWSDEHVKESLDLCLSCKACKSECPANVDIATYKAEFLSHYYETMSRPLSAYAFGMIDKWARIASLAPRTANLLGSAPGLNQLVGKILHLAPQRQLPRLASNTFRRWARKQGVGTIAGKDKQKAAESGKNREVVLWVDTFNNYFHPETMRAALEVLGGAGFSVRIIPKHICCGRPLYDFGMLDKAKAYLLSILEILREQIDAGTPMVVLEPSCASVFRDELRNLLPKDERATRLRNQTFLLGEFLKHRAPGYQPPPFSGKVILHGHCHQKALMGMSDEESLLRKMGSEVESLDSGCCGMAGSFGFEKKNYAISQALAERVLLPAVRRSGADAVIVSDGFSCREQIFQATGRRAVHLAEAIRMGMEQPISENGKQK